MEKEPNTTTVKNPGPVYIIQYSLVVTVPHCHCAVWHTSEICGFALAEGAKEFADLRFAYFFKKFFLPTSEKDKRKKDKKLHK